MGPVDLSFHLLGFAATVQQGRDPPFQTEPDAAGVHLRARLIIDVAALAEFEQSYKGESVFDEKGENLNFEEIYEEAISHQENEKQFHHPISRRQHVCRLRRHSCHLCQFIPQCFY